MIDIISIYESAARDDAAKEENGTLNYGMFNRLIKRAEINLLKFLTGDLVPAQDFPMPYDKQKNKDYLKRFIKRLDFNNDFTLPDDYFMWDNLYKIGSSQQTDCDTGLVTLIDQCNTPIEILDGQKFYNRCNSYIKGIKPSENNPIAKIVNNRVEMKPKNLGSVSLEYIRYPIFGRINTIPDPVFNDEIADPLTSINLEWDEWATEPLIWFVNNRFAVHTGSKSAMENNLLNKARG